MVQRAQVVALALSVAIGAASVAGLTLGSRKALVHMGPTTLPALDLVDVYATIVVALVGAPDAGSPGPRTVTVSRTIYDTCMPPPPSARATVSSTADRHDPNVPPPRNTLCGRTKVGTLKPDIEAALTEALARRGLTAVFGEGGEVRLHQVVTEASGTPAADGNAGDLSEMQFHFKPVKGRLQLQNATLEWIR